jgi:hypothetical protein
MKGAAALALHLKKGATRARKKTIKNQRKWDSQKQFLHVREAEDEIISIPSVDM